jgi:hypothetical protein
VLLVGLWFVAGIVAVGIASAGVGAVSRQLTGDAHPAALSADEVQDELAAAATSSSTTAGDPPGAGATTTTTTAPATTTTTARSARATTVPTTSPPTTSVEPITRTYRVVGGSATIRFSPSAVTVLFATPAPGFTAEVEPHDGAIRVEFESEGHKSRIDAWWAGGPQAETREDNEGDDD